MNKILLIDRLDPQDTSDEIHEVFFTLGEMNKPEVEEKIIDTIKSSDITYSDEMVLKYNGIGLNLKVKEIPKVTKILTDAGILIYGIYQIYSPYEDL